MCPRNGFRTCDGCAGCARTRDFRRPREPLPGGHIAPNRILAVLKPLRRLPGLRHGARSTPRLALQALFSFFVANIAAMPILGVLPARNAPYPPVTLPHETPHPLLSAMLGDALTHCVRPFGHYLILPFYSILQTPQNRELISLDILSARRYAREANGCRASPCVPLLRLLLSPSFLFLPLASSNASSP